MASVPRADAKADRRRQRRALTEAELIRLLHVARYRPLAEFGRVSKPVDQSESNAEPADGKRRKWTYAELAFDDIVSALERARDRLRNSPHRIEQLEHLGRERSLIYKSLVLTGLRRGELASLTIGQLHLDAKHPYVDLYAADSKNRQAAQIPLRHDLANELGEWIENMRRRNRRNPDANEEQFCLPLTAVPKADDLPSNTPLFTVADKLVKIFDRDLKLAGIRKRDESGRTVDVHALRHCFGTMLSRSGVAPRTAQAAMRHSTIDLTMNVYTDPRLLDLHQAVESLPGLSLETSLQTSRQRATGTFGAGEGAVAPAFAPTPDNSCKSESIAVTTTGEMLTPTLRARTCEKADFLEENSPFSACDNGLVVEPAAGVEPATPALRMRRPIVASENQQEVTTTPESVCTSVCTSQAENAYEMAPGESPDAPADADLAAVVKAWPSLPPALRAGIVAMIRATAAST